MRAILSEDGDGFSGGGTTQLFDVTGSITATITFSVDAIRIAVELPD